MSIQCAIVPVTPYQQNCSIIKCEDTARAAIVDPGGDVERILEAVEQLGASVEKIILTHAHLDHCAASDVLRQQLEVPIEGPHREDAFWLEGLPEACRMSGFPPAEAFEPDRWLEQGDAVTVGEQTLQVFHCPGHTPGHVVFLYAPQKVAWVGDVLFQGSIGRTDFPRGNHQQLIDSIRNTLFPLGDDITFIPGHGPTSTFGQERQGNPFVADSLHG
jgi:glyoxylase-like metal-dependent hydrolase (beta-lactamase superfamily II)